MITQELRTYIKQQLGAGVAKDIIKQTLSVQGWNEQDLTDAFFAIENSQSTPAVTPPPAFQMPIRNPVQPITVVSSGNVSSGGSKSTWLVVVIILLLICAGGAFAAYSLGIFTSSAPATTNLPTASSSLLTGLENASTSPEMDAATQIQFDSLSATTTSTTTESVSNVSTAPFIISTSPISGEQCQSQVLLRGKGFSPTASVLFSVVGSLATRTSIQASYISEDGTALLFDYAKNIGMNSSGPSKIYNISINNNDGTPPSNSVNFSCSASR